MDCVGRSAHTTKIHAFPDVYFLLHKFNVNTSKTQVDQSKSANQLHQATSNAYSMLFPYYIEIREANRKNMNANK